LHDDGIDLAHKLSELAASSSLWQDLSLRGISNSKLYSLSRQVSSIKTLLESQGLIGG